VTGVSLVTGGMVTRPITPYPTVAQIAEGVWDEDLTTHNTSKSAGWFVKKIKAITDVILAMVT